jgi:bacteriorhodopsin
MLHLLLSHSTWPHLATLPIPCQKRAHLQGWQESVFIFLISHLSFLWFALFICKAVGISEMTIDACKVTYER